MSAVGAMQSHGHNKPHDSRSIVPALAKNARTGHPQFWNGKQKEKQKSGPPSITLSALSRDTWTSEGFDFSLRGGFAVVFGVAFAFAHATKARVQNPAVETWFHQPSIRSLWFRP
jgi:hypothetical protein